MKKGEKSTQIVFANKIMRSEVNDTGETVDRNFSFLKAYSVFNAEQIDKLPAQFAPPAPAPEPNPNAIGSPKDWAAYATAEVIHGGERACFIPSLDRIELPEPDAFFTPEASSRPLIHLPNVKIFRAARGLFAVGQQASILTQARIHSIMLGSWVSAEPLYARSK